MNGKFIVIEGQGFTGKTTQANALVEKLKESGIEAISLRHPGSSVHAEKYRQLLLEKKLAGVLTPDEELELIFQALKSIIDEIIIPELNKGTWVVLTRFIPSAIVYQGYEEGLDKEAISKMGEKISQHLKPDLSLLIDLPSDEILKRQSNAHDNEIHAYNNPEVEVLETRRNGYLEVFKNMENAEIIDGSKHKKEISEQIWKKITAKFNLTT